MEIVTLWLIMAGIFLVGEIASRTYYLLGLSMGSLAGSVATHMKFSFWGQWALFFFVSIVFMVLTRELKKK
ncbi:MAG: NfeD family protein [Candidatus Methanofastidiosia archaeon]